MSNAVTIIATGLRPINEFAPTEDPGDPDWVARLAAGIDPEDMTDVWDEQPAIIVDQDGLIIDGHHRVAAARAAGLTEWRTITIDRATFEASADRLGWERALAAVCDELGDDVTWAQVTR